MSVPIDIATSETVAFLEDWFGDKRVRMLEVGAGEGHVAKSLAARSHTVVAVDADSASVERARERGVDAHLAQWPDFSAEPFDAIAFTRSLHHIEELEAAVDRALELLVPGGLVFVEDFSFESLDDAMVAWYREQLQEIDAAVGLEAPDDSFVASILAGQESATILESDCHRDLHTWIQMRDVLIDRFVELSSVSSPYLYRYLVRIAPNRADLTDIVVSVKHAENAAILDGRIQPLGRRFVGRR